MGISRSSIYYQPVIDPYDLLLMQLIDEQYTRSPFYGSRKMIVFMRRGGHRVNRKRVHWLMRQMGLEAIYPWPRLSQAHPEHEVYPYLLQEVSLHLPNQVWAAAITYIRLSRGFLYLVPIIGLGKERSPEFGRLNVYFRAGGPPLRLLTSSPIGV